VSPWTASKVYCSLWVLRSHGVPWWRLLGLVVAAIMALGRQKSAATFATSVGGCLISGTRNDRESIQRYLDGCRLICWKLLVASSPWISHGGVMCRSRRRKSAAWRCRGLAALAALTTGNDHRWGVRILFAASFMSFRSASKSGRVPNVCARPVPVQHHRRDRANGLA